MAGDYSDKRRGKREGASQDDDEVDVRSATVAGTRGRRYVRHAAAGKLHPVRESAGRVRISRTDRAEGIELNPWARMLGRAHCVERS